MPGKETEILIHHREIPPQPLLSCFLPLIRRMADDQEEQSDAQDDSQTGCREQDPHMRGNETNETIGAVFGRGVFKQGKVLPEFSAFLQESLK